ncbi:hypothetical protein [Caballeronia arationis]|jgi:hypothetical protein|uniref:hypothetical protein n=1 Tax=Caballeronia arationis TaxID=1777142 RepID=UPI000BE43A82|nr:hypothetical protein [Caballeronia arationis]
MNGQQLSILVDANLMSPELKELPDLRTFDDFARYPGVYSIDVVEMPSDALHDRLPERGVRMNRLRCSPHRADAQGIAAAHDRPLLP